MISLCSKMLSLGYVKYPEFSTSRICRHHKVYLCPPKQYCLSDGPPHVQLPKKVLDVAAGNSYSRASRYWVICSKHMDWDCKKIYLCI